MRGTTVLFRADVTGAAVPLLPVVRALRAAVEFSELHLFLKDAPATLFQFEPGIMVHPFSQIAKRNRKEPNHSSLGISRPVETLIDLSTAPSAEGEKLAALLTPARVFSLHKAPVESQPLEEAEILRRFLESCFETRLFYSNSNFSKLPLLSPLDYDEALEKMGTKAGTWLGLTPFSRSERRSPPIRRWEKLLSHVSKHGPFQRYFLFGIPSDYKRLQRLRLSAAEPEKVECVFPSTFRTLTAYLDRLDGLITIDSGALHLAYAQEVRTMGILSETEIERWLSPKPGSLWVPRGVFHRFPTALELSWAFDRWQTPTEPPTASAH